MLSVRTTVATFVLLGAIIVRGPLAEQHAGRGRNPRPRLGSVDVQGYRDRAVAHGRSDGFRTGFANGYDRRRYTPVRHPRYRCGENGYFDAYGPREAYRLSYREGFRKGYEEGYRAGAGATRHGSRR